ncbi:MAG: Ig-like domain-containing protein, partial [Anaerolineales bacterium]|nr:Ig-like domain-containing protein [Anaerolineales bacterium]
MNEKNNNKTTKIKTSRLMLWLGIAFGLILTAFLWLGDSEQTYTSLRWISYLGIVGVGLYLIVRTSYRRAFTLLALFASVSILYLFPALLGPGCDGMPRAFAVQCERRWDCADDECCHGGECLSKNNPKCGGGDPPPTSPPTISSAISCTMGSNGWCVGNAQLTLNASDPQGYAVTISGNMGNVPISCNGSCTVNLPEGSGTATYTVTAATSGKTASGSKAWWYDPDLPVSDVNVSGTSGSNGWYISAVNASANGSDSISGLANATLSADGGVAAMTALLTDGVHSVTTTARDVAGNTASRTQTISVDTTSPTIHISTAGNQAQDGWFSTAVDLSATAEDVTSGVAGSVSISFDNGATWVSGARTLYDGRYDVMFRALDHAGNIATSQMSLKIDTQPPSISLSEAGRQGQNGWYVSSANVSIEVSDNLSGVTSTQVRVNGGAWQAGAFITVEEGIHTIDFQSFDSAGNMQSASREIRVDLTPPAYTFYTTLNGAVLANTVNLDGTALDETSSVQNVEFSSEGKT